MDYEKRLRSRGYRRTPQREAVLDILKENEGCPLKPEEIHRRAARKHGGTGLATVYRTLELFRELGIVDSVHLHGGSQHYEIRTDNHHHHLVCVSCGGVEVFEGCMIEAIEGMARDQSDFLVTSHCMSLFGYCRECLVPG